MIRVRGSLVSEGEWNMTTKKTVEKRISASEKDLMKRYLMWCYKTTKEELDKIDRYFTQLKIDDFMLDDLVKTKEYQSGADKDFQKKVDDFEKYMCAKETRVLSQKFKNVKTEEVDAEYLYLKKRFESIEKAICHFLGKPQLEVIKDLYEEEMTMRILEAREHH